MKKRIFSSLLECYIEYETYSLHSWVMGVLTYMDEKKFTIQFYDERDCSCANFKWPDSCNLNEKRHFLSITMTNYFKKTYTEKLLNELI